VPTAAPFATTDADAQLDAVGESWQWLAARAPGGATGGAAGPAASPPAAPASPPPSPSPFPSPFSAPAAPPAAAAAAGDDVVRVLTGDAACAAQRVRGRVFLPTTGLRDAFAAYLDILDPKRHAAGPMTRDDTCVRQRIRESETALELWCELVGDMPLAAVTAAHAWEFRDKLGNVPRRHGRAPFVHRRPDGDTERMHAGAAVALADSQEAARIDAVEWQRAQGGFASGDAADAGEHGAFVPRLKRRTINRHIDNLARLFRELHAAAVLPRNPFHKVRFKNHEIGHDQRAERPHLDDDDMRRFLQSPLMVGRGHFLDRHGRPQADTEAYWLALLFTFHGLRSEEGAQLEVDDVRRIDGVWCLHVRSAGRRRLKNAESQRLVPVAEIAIRLGLLDLVARRRRDGHRRLFPALTLRRGRKVKPNTLPVNRYCSLSCQVLQRLGAQLRRLGVAEGATPYSLRHSFVTKLGNTDLPDRLIDELVGHKPQGQTNARYFKGAQVHLLKAAIDRLDYGIELEWAGDGWRIAPPPADDGDAGIPAPAGTVIPFAARGRAT
jgi:integrase